MLDLGNALLYIDDFGTATRSISQHWLSDERPLARANALLGPQEGTLLLFLLQAVRAALSGPADLLREMPVSVKV